MDFFNPQLPIILGVASYNTKAIHFYGSLGFIKHIGKYRIKEFHTLRNGKKIPTITMILER